MSNFKIIILIPLLLVFHVSCSGWVKGDKTTKHPSINDSDKNLVNQSPPPQQPIQNQKTENEVVVHISGEITNLQKDVKQGKDKHPGESPDSRKEITQKGGVTPADRDLRKTYLMIDVDEANLREGPGLEFPIKKALKKGESFELIEATDTLYLDRPWYKVKDKNGKEGYIWAESVQILKGDESEALSKSEIDTLYLSNKKITGGKQGFISTPKEIESRGVILNFENTEINDIIATIGELLGLNYIIEPGVAGKVTIHTSGKIPVNELFSVLEQILEVNNLSVIKIGEYYRFLPMTEAKKKPIEVYVGRGSSPIPPSDRMIIQLIPLKFLPVESIKGVLTPLLTKNGSLFDIPGSHTLGLVDTASNVKRLLDIVDALDVSNLERMHVKLFQIQYARASDINRELTEIFLSLGIKEKEQFLRFIPLQRINSVLMVSISSEMVQTAKRWIEKLDKPVIQGNMGTYVYYVQNGDAGNIAGIITSLYGVRKKTTISGAPSTSKSEVVPPKYGELPQIKIPPEPPKPVDTIKESVTSVEILGAGDVEGDVTIIPDKETNSLIMRTSPQNYPVILETIKRLDKVATQVMIEIMVAELTLDEKTQFGLEWAIKTGSVGFGVDTGSSLAANIGKNVGQLSTPGFSAFVQDTDKLIGLFQAFASDSKFNVILTPMILTSENKPATISIANEIPIETTTFLQTGTTPVTTSSFQYKSVGTKLTVTPKINEERFVNLDILQEVSQVNEADISKYKSPPFFTRNLQTSVIVSDKQSLMLGGLIEDRNDNSRQGIPWLYKIPGIGWLFGSQRDVKRKTELIMLITPHVIANSSEAKAVTEEFQGRLESLQRSFIRSN